MADLSKGLLHAVLPGDQDDPAIHGAHSKLKAEDVQIGPEAFCCHHSLAACAGSPSSPLKFFFYKNLLKFLLNTFD